HLLHPAAVAHQGGRSVHLRLVADAVPRAPGAGLYQRRAEAGVPRTGLSRVHGGLRQDPRHLREIQEDRRQLMFASLPDIEAAIDGYLAAGQYNEALANIVVGVHNHHKLANASLYWPAAR